MKGWIEPVVKGAALYGVLATTTIVLSPLSIPVVVATSKAVGACAVSLVTIAMVLDIQDDRARIINLVLTNLGIEVKKKDSSVRPKLVSVKDNTHTYKVPPGICLKHFKTIQPALNSALDAETEIWESGKRIHIRILDNPLPEEIMFTQEREDNNESTC